MIKKIIFESPINPLSLGNVGINLLKSFKNKEIDVLYSPIGQADISAYKLSDDFKSWLQLAGNRFLKEFDRNLVTIRNWHLAGSHSWPSDKKYLLTYSEVDSATQEELNIIKNTNKTFFCGNYSKQIFGEFAPNVDSFNLGFDSDLFYKTNKTYFTDGRIQFFLGGKLEKRKKSLEILSLWAKKYGKKQGEFWRPDETKCFLNCQIVNPFYDIKQQEQQISQALGNQKYINIQFFNFLQSDSLNDLLNSTDIDLTGLSGGESWNLIPFNITCLGKWSIVLNAHGNKSWSNSNNSIFVEPSGKESAVDGIFFQPQSPFNMGNFYTWSKEDVEKAMDLAIIKCKTVNTEGEKLKDIFTYDKTVDYILNKIEEDLNKN